MKGPNERAAAAGPAPASEGPADPELEANATERRQASELLAGFDRPGRRRSAPGGQDFVDYYASGKKNAAGGEAPMGTDGLPPMRREAATFILPRGAKRRLSPWLGWVAAALVLTAIGGGVAYVATSEDGRAAHGASPTAPSAATTITSGSANPTVVTTTGVAETDAEEAAASGDEEEAAPAPSRGVTAASAAATATTGGPRAAAGGAASGRVPGPAPGAGAGGGAAAGGAGAGPQGPGEAAPKPPPRDDLIREMH